MAYSQYLSYDMQVSQIARASFFFNLCNEIEIRKFGITDWDVNLIEL